MEPLCTKANIKPFKQAGLVSQSTAICFFNLICVATSLTILSKWVTEFQTEEQELMSHTHSGYKHERRSNDGSDESGPSDCLSLSSPCIPLSVPSRPIPSHPPSLHSSIWDVLCVSRQTKEAGGWPPSLTQPFLTGTNGSLCGPWQRDWPF